MAERFADANEPGPIPRPCEPSRVGRPTTARPAAETLARSLATSSIGLAVVDTGQRVVHVNPAFATIIGSPCPTPTDALPAWVAQASPAAAEMLERMLASPDAASRELNTPDQGTITLHVAALDGATRLVIAEDHSRHAFTGQPGAPAHCDPLTGLGNRGMLATAVQQWRPSQNEHATLALIMVDLDRFKLVNDTLGHATGDALLKLVAKRLKSATREGDTLIRFGGDEFVILPASGLQPEGATSVGERVVELMSRPFLVDGHQVNIGASVGISLSEATTSDSAQLLQRADLALCEAKAAGRGTVRFFEPHLARQALERRQMELDLRRALGLKAFSLHYQPQVSLGGGRITGFEALIRWNSAERGLISPAEFIPLAEEIGEIHAIGEWVIREACKQAASWPGPLSVAVNVSPIQFERDGIVDVVRTALEVSGLAPERLDLEITEGVLMNNTDAVMRSLRAIRDLGVGIAMDDFGTGYSSLSHLNSFPFSKLKIDQSFVRNQHSHKSKALIDAIIALSTSLGLTTVAEGIETQTQYDALAQSGCASAQGYLIGRPMPSDQVAPYLASANYKPIE